jgi:lipopolysaccharide biosynthesis protein
MKRLFIFAAYDKQGIINKNLLYYLNCLSNYGDLLFIMDNDISKKEIYKLNGINNILYKEAKRHGEYDFGSYKRGFLYARDKNLLKKYDWVYFVNDSVYCVNSNLDHLLSDMESSEKDFTGIIDFKNEIGTYAVQSWFVGISKKLINTEFINNFFSGIHKEESKDLLCTKYECGLTMAVTLNGFSYYTKIQNLVNAHIIYDQPMFMVNNGIPFIKKREIQNLKESKWLYVIANEAVVDDIIQDIKRLNIRLNDKDTITTNKVFLLGIPLFSIRYRKTFRGCVKYLYLFDLIRITKLIIEEKRDME